MTPELHFISSYLSQVNQNRSKLRVFHGSRDNGIALLMFMFVLLKGVIVISEELNYF